MPPKKPAVDSADPPAPSSSDAPVEEKAEKKSDAAMLRKPATHPTTEVMVKEALKALDSRKGVSSHAIQSYIKQQHPSMDPERLKPLVRKALRKGMETGTLMRPGNSSLATGAVGKFRLAPKFRESKPKSENVDPNMQKAPNAAKDGAKKSPKAGATKKKDADSGKTKSSEESKPPRKSKKDKEADSTEAAKTKPAPAKKPKAKKTEEKRADEGTSASTKPKAAKTGKRTQSKAAEVGGDANAAKTTGKRGRKPAE